VKYWTSKKASTGSKQAQH